MFPSFSDTVFHPDYFGTHANPDDRGSTFSKRRNLLTIVAVSVLNLKEQDGCTVGSTAMSSGILSEAVMDNSVFNKLDSFNRSLFARCFKICI
jgi:hypothetical protein